MTPKTQSTGLSCLLAYVLPASGVIDGSAADHLLTGTRRWDNAQTLRQLVSAKDGRESVKKFEEGAKRVDAAADKKAYSNEQGTYAARACLEIKINGRGHAVSRHSSPCKNAEVDSGALIVNQENTGIFQLVAPVTAGDC